MNSFRFIGRAIEAAFRQQVAAHEAGEEVAQSTYDYDPDTDRLTVHRSKEEADDYRYFPEPDLVPVEPPAELVERLRGQVPELPVDADPAARGRARASRAAAELVDDRQRVEGGGARSRGPRLEDGGRDRDEPRATSCSRTPARSRGSCRRTSRARRSTRRSPPRPRGRSTAEDYLSRTALGDEDALAPVIDAVLAANPGAGRDLPRRQGGRARLLRRPGDARDAGQGRPEGRQPAAAGEASRLGRLRIAVAERAEDRGDTTGAASTAIAICGEVWARSSPASERPERRGRGAQRGRGGHGPSEQAVRDEHVRVRRPSPSRCSGTRTRAARRRRRARRRSGRRGRRRRRAPSRTPRAGSRASGSAAAAAGTASNPARSATPWSATKRPIAEAREPLPVGEDDDRDRRAGGDEVAGGDHADRRAQERNAPEVGEPLAEGRARAGHALLLERRAHQQERSRREGVRDGVDEKRQAAREVEERAADRRRERGARSTCAPSSRSTRRRAAACGTTAFIAPLEPDR